MKRSRVRWVIAAALAAGALAACSSAVRQSPAQGAAPLSPSQQAAADSGRPPFTAETVHFMSGMIGHHAQAVLIAGWAPSHGASPTLQALCERIVVSQRDEIGLMKRWLSDRHLPVPSGDASHDMMPGMEHMAGMDHAMMPGMLNAAQLTALDNARGADFDRLFLADMIQHHEGAITMVNQLFASSGALQDDAVFKFASDVNADQTTEIDRMTQMLSSLQTTTRSP